MKIVYKNSLLISFTILLAFIFTAVSAQQVKYSAPWSQPGLTLHNQSVNQVELGFSISEFNMTPMEIDGSNMLSIELPGVFLPNNEGMPNLPGMSRYIAIPQGSKAVLNIKASRIERIQNVDIAPAPRIPLETETGPLFYKKNTETYATNAFYPAEPIKLSAPSKIRGTDVVMVGITPFQYNPVTKELIVYRDLQLSVEFQGGNGHFGEERLRSRWFDPILMDAVLNYESLPVVDYGARTRNLNGKDAGCEYLIVTPTGPEFLQWADSIKKFRTEQGILTDIKTVQELGGNNPATLKTYFANAYNTWDIPPVAVLLLGDYGTNVANSITSPIWDSYCVSDNILADVDNDDMPEIVFARITANNAAQLQVMISKFLNYERNPPTSPDFYAHPITALGWQTERWFQICSEVVGGYFKHEHGKDPVRVNAIYQGTPGTTWSTATNTATVVNYFGPNGLQYIPQTPAELGGWTGGNATMVNNAINSGAFMLQHRDHGMETGWGEPAYVNSNINGLTNTDLTFVFSVNCLTGKYNYSSESFAEKFHRYTYNGQNSGALGLLAASEVSYSFVNDAFTWGMYDNMFPDFMPAYGMPIQERDFRPAFGNASGKYFLQQSAWPYNTGDKEVTYHLFHHHGCAFLNVYSEVPQNMAVNVNPILYAGTTEFSIQAPEGAFVALTVDGAIIGTATATGAPQSITIAPQVPPAIVKLVITKQNYYRYEQNIEVIPPSGPYVVRDSFVINDLNGNGNGQADYGESILMTLVMKNVGVEIAPNVVVTISSTDEYVTITDNTASYGNIDPNGTATVVDGFAMTIAQNIPDQHGITVQVDATDGTSSWTSYIGFNGNAPALEMGTFTISDATGNNNGKIDPGETVSITVTAGNDGHADAYNVTGQLTSSDPYLTINTTSPQSYGTITAGGTGNASFSVTAASNTPAGHMAMLNFGLAADMGITGSGTFQVVIGQIPVVIIDLDPNHSSGPAMQTAMSALGVSAEYLTSMPADMNLYSSAFVCLGIYSSNHTLSSSEGDALAEFLDNGGSLYMEGGDTWYYDTQTAVHEMFYINATGDGSSDLSTQLGQAGTFTAGMTFAYQGENNWIDHLEPMAPAVAVLKNQTPSYGTSIAYAGATYKTIGASHEFGGLQDNGANTKAALMEQYLIHMGILQTGVTANFTANITEVCEGSQVQYTDNSTGAGITSWEWTFEGGTPAASTEQNPLVTYATAGVYDVTLTVTSGNGSNTLTKQDYINTMTVPPAPSPITGSSDVCQGEVSMYTIDPMASVTGYTWHLLPFGCGILNVENNTATITWSEVWTGTATLKVCATNQCGEGPDSQDFEVIVMNCTGVNDIHSNSSVTIQPNPNTGLFSLILNRNEAQSVTVTDVAGKVVYTLSNISNPVSGVIDIDLVNLPGGIYYVSVQTGDARIVRKIVVNK